MSAVSNVICSPNCVAVYPGTNALKKIVDVGNDSESRVQTDPSVGAFPVITFNLKAKSRVTSVVLIGCKDIKHVTKTKVLIKNGSDA